MKKISFKSVSSTLSQQEMKNVLGGSGAPCGDTSNCSGHCPMGLICVSNTGNPFQLCACKSW